MGGREVVIPFYRSVIQNRDVKRVGIFRIRITRSVIPFYRVRVIPGITSGKDGKGPQIGKENRSGKFPFFTRVPGIFQGSSTSFYNGREPVQLEQDKG